MRRIGYLRVSTGDQLLDRQVNALRPLCDELHLETLSAVAKRRPVYQHVMRRLRRGDTLVVLDTDRAYRSAREALNELHLLEARGVCFSVVNFPLSTTTAEGRFLLTVTLARDQLEREMSSRRTREGLAAARARGVVLGPPRKLTAKQLRDARMALERRETTVVALARQLEVGRWTLSRNLRERASAPEMGKAKQ